MPRLEGSSMGKRPFSQYQIMEILLEMTKRFDDLDKKMDQSFDKNEQELRRYRRTKVLSRG